MVRHQASVPSKAHNFDFLKCNLQNNRCFVKIRQELVTYQDLCGKPRPKPEKNCHRRHFHLKGKICYRILKSTAPCSSKILYDKRKVDKSVEKLLFLDFLLLFFSLNCEVEQGGDRKLNSSGMTSNFPGTSESS